jgi:hypothetical protein
LKKKKLVLSSAEMISRLIAITLLCALISSNLSTLFVYAEFKSNQKYIAASLCENRNKPQLNCQGKCYLMKKLKEAEDKEKKQEKNAQKKGAYDLFFAIRTVYTSLPLTLLKKEKPVVKNFQLPKFTSEILHPPPALSYFS